MAALSGHLAGLLVLPKQIWVVALGLAMLQPAAAAVLVVPLYWELVVVLAGEERVPSLPIALALRVGSLALTCLMPLLVVQLLTL
jgi:hypothetical protein